MGLHATRAAERRPWQLVPLSPELSQLRLLTIVVPIGFLMVVVLLVRGPAHEELHAFPEIVAVLVLLVAGVALFSLVVFTLIGRLERELVLRNLALEAMLSVGRAANSTLPLPELLDVSLEAIMTATGAGAAEAWLCEDDEFVLVRRRGATLHTSPERLLMQVSAAIGSSETGLARPLPHPGAQGDVDGARPPPVEPASGDARYVPIVYRGNLLGVLATALESAPGAGRRSGAGDGARRVLESIAEQVAVAVENARLQARVLDQAVLRERERLSRELHDGLAQTLGFVNTQTLAIKSLLGRGAVAEAQVEAAVLETAVRQVSTDLRDAIVGLRAGEDELVEGVRACVARHRLVGVDVDLEVGLDVGSPKVPAAVVSQLVRILQEALSNVRKHSDTRTARVAVAHADGSLFVEVADTGPGFDVEQARLPDRGCLGLHSMRERAEVIGARLDVVSAPGRGTIVVVRIPLEGLGANNRCAS